jgi:hypothetical protein
MGHERGAIVMPETTHRTVSFTYARMLKDTRTNSARASLSPTP